MFRSRDLARSPPAVRFRSWARSATSAGTVGPPITRSPLSAKRRFSKGLLFDANWTWSHSIDDASDPGATLNETNLPQNVYDLGNEKASSSFDHRQRVVVSFIYHSRSRESPVGPAPS